MVTTRLFDHVDEFETFTAGQVIFQAGDPGDKMYVAKQGTVELQIGSTLRETMTAGELFGEMALIEQKERTATAVALTECQLVPITEQRFTFLVHQTPYFALIVMQTMADRLRRMDQSS